MLMLFATQARNMDRLVKQFVPTERLRSSNAVAERDRASVEVVRTRTWLPQQKIGDRTGANDLD